MTRIVSVADWQPERRVLASVTLGARRPLISGWVWVVSGSLCAGLMLADLINGRL